MTPEVRILVPKQIQERAQKLADNGLYEKALELLDRNKMVFEIYDTFMKMKVREAPKRRYHFNKPATR